MARIHHGRWIELRGRIANSFKVCGVTVNAERIEQAIRSVSNISDVVVVPVPHDLLGNIPVALIVHDGSAPAINRRALKKRLEFPFIEMPREFICVSEIPSTPAGKVDRVAARAMIGERIAAASQQAAAGRRRRATIGGALLLLVRLWYAARTRTRHSWFPLRHPRAMWLILKRALRRWSRWW
jgi:hypothetical protein